MDGREPASPLPVLEEDRDGKLERAKVSNVG